MVSLSCFTAPMNDLICLTVLGFSARVRVGPNTKFRPNTEYRIYSGSENTPNTEYRIYSGFENGPNTNTE